MSFDVIINKFIKFDNIEIIKAVQYSPDTILTLLSIDRIKYMLVETDYFDEYYETIHVHEAFGLKVEKWVKPKSYNPKEYSSPAYFNKKTNIAYGLARLIDSKG